MLLLAVTGGDVVANDHAKLERCLAEENAVWSDCFQKFNTQSGEASVPNLPVPRVPPTDPEHYRDLLAEALGVPEGSGGNLIDAIDLWAPNPYEAVVQSYISGAAFAVGDSLLMLP